MRIPRVSIGREGTAAIEFGLIAPLLLFILVGVVELGVAVRQAMQVQDAAEAGALYAGKYGWDQAAIAKAVVAATGATTLTAQPAPELFCGCPGPGGIAAIACTATCAGGTSAQHYVRVSASMPHSVLLVGLGLPVPATLTGRAVVRVQ